MRSEEIWDALADDEALDALPDALAKAAGARSAQLLYRSNETPNQSLAFNYWRAQDMARYAESFVPFDPWIASALRPDRINRVHAVSRFVPAKEFAKSVLYNDFFREVGDDTFWCVGACLSTPRGMGHVAVHRGRTAPDFEPENVQALERLLPQLQQMFIVRGAGLDASARYKALEQALERLGVGVLLVAASGRVLVANAEAEEILNEGAWMTSTGGLRAIGPERTAFELLMARATAASRPTGGTLLLRSSRGKLLQVDISPARSASVPNSALITARRLEPPGGLETLLRTSFGLTPAESLVALRLADGASARVIANERNVSIQTVQVQIRSVLHKTGLTKASALASLVGQLSVLGERREN